MKDVIERVNKYLTEYARFNGNDKERIHTLQAGSEREAILTVDDIRLLVSEAMETEHPENGNGAVGYGLQIGDTLQCKNGPVMVNTRDSECTVMHIIPPGWQLVPQEPTLAMLDEIKINDSFTVRALLTRYEAMLSNAPQPPKSSFVIRQSRNDDKDPDCPFCGGSGHKDDIPPQVVDGDVVKHLRRMAANSQSVLYSHRTVLANAASEIERLRARLPEIKIAVDNLVYQEIRYVAVSAGPVSSSMSAGIIKEAEAVLNQRRKILNDLLTT